MTSNTHLQNAHSDLIVRSSTLLRKAMEHIAKNTFGICFVVDEDNRLLGSLSDGDIRKALIETAVANILDQSCVKAINSEPIVYRNGDLLPHNLNPKIRHIPVVDERNRLLLLH